MTIFGLVNKNSGPGFHRIHMPLVMMGDSIRHYITNSIRPEDLAGDGYSPGGVWLGKPDAIYYNREVSDDVLKHAGKAGCKIVVDVDDYWLLDPHHIAYKLYQQHNFEARQIRHLQVADVVTTTHARLAEKIYRYNKNVVILPNAIPKHEYFPTQRKPSERPRIFWQGSITHERDIELLRNPLKRLDKSRFMMVLAGFTEGQPEWNRMLSAYTNGLKIPNQILPGLPPEQYYQHYRHADICMAPLLDTGFNSLKSNLKVLEAAHMGLPVVASHVHPYIGMVGISYVHKQGDWLKNINALADESERAARGKALQEYCTTHYHYDIINLKRKQCFQ